MPPLISVIIAVYNVEGYLDKCMKSVLSQTYENYEIILVDDGSTDNSGKICDTYAKKFPRVLSYHKSNEGPSVARNYGIERAKGEYISFIDADDYITADYLSYLWCLIRKYDANLSIAQFVRIRKGNIIKTTSDNYDYVIPTERAIEQLCIGRHISPVLWGKLYTTDILKKNLLAAGAYYYEDLDVIYKWITDSSRVAIGTNKVYCYVQRSGSQLHKCAGEKILYGITASERMFNYIQTCFPAVSNAAHVRCCVTALDMIIRILDNDECNAEYYSIVQKFLMNHFNYIKHDNIMSIMQKIDCRCYIAGYRVAKAYRSVRRKLSRI